MRERALLRRLMALGRRLDRAAPAHLIDLVLAGGRYADIQACIGRGRT